MGLFDVISLQSFTVFPEYFISISIMYVLIVIALITYTVYGLMLQKAVSECMVLILLMSCYLIINDDLIALDFVTFNSSIINDYFAFFTKIVICFFSAIYFLLISDSLKEQKLTSFEYLIVILFAILGLILMCSSYDLLIAYLAIELSSLAFYILASFKKTSNYSIESGIKYFIIGAISSSFFLLGSSFIYCSTGSINFLDFSEIVGPLVDDFPYRSSPYYEIASYICGEMTYGFGLRPQALFDEYSYIQLIGQIYPDFIVGLAEFYCYVAEVERNEPPVSEYDFNFIELGLVLILFSLFIKLALAPFHLWSLDVYEGSPSSSTVFFAVITKLSIFVILVRLCYMNFFSIMGSLYFYIFFVGVLSIFVGSFGGLRQRKFKTLLAYSSTSHMGYSLIAFSTFSYMGVQMLFFYMIIYMISGLAIWSVFLLLKVKKNYSFAKYNKELGDFALLKKSNSAMAFALSVIMFSIAGIPPMIGFIAKMSVFLSVMGNKIFYFIGLVSILFSVVSTFYYIRLIKILYFENLLIGKLYHSISTEKTLILSVLVFSLAFLFLNPTLLYLFCYKIVLSF